MEYKGITIVQLRNKNILLKLPRGGKIIVGCNKFMNGDELKKVADTYIASNPYIVDSRD